MSSDLYQQVILDHNNKPRNYTVLEDANCYALGKNPLCGDQFAVYVKRAEDGTIENVTFQGEGCAISKASASMMTTLVKGKPQDYASLLKNEFQGMLTGTLDEETTENHLGKLKLFAGVRKYPVRVKCATLAWHTLAAALDGSQQEISTEA